MNAPESSSDETLISIVNKLYAKHKHHGKYLKLIATELISQGFKSSGGKEWSSGLLRSYLNTHVPDFKFRTSRKTEEVPTSKKRGEPKPEETQSPQKQTLYLDAKRPVFRHDLPKQKVSADVREEIVKRVKDKLNRDRVRTGGNMTRLIEILLYHYVGCPDDVLEPPYEGDKTQE